MLTTELSTSRQLGTEAEEKLSDVDDKMRMKDQQL